MSTTARRRGVSSMVEPPRFRGPEPRFAHDSERRFARILDVHGVAWEYEPVEFALRWDAGGRPTSGFRPDFWLPADGLFVELTTMSQPLVTKKNGKVRRLRELHPDIRVTLLYQRDVLALLVADGPATGAWVAHRLATYGIDAGDGPGGNDRAGMARPA